MSNTVKARRGTETKEFSHAAWDLLPADKYGWHEEVELPDELKELLGAVLNAADPSADLGSGSSSSVNDRVDPVAKELNPETDTIASQSGTTDSIPEEDKVGADSSGKVEDTSSAEVVTNGGTSETSEAEPATTTVQPGSTKSEMPAKDHRKGRSAKSDADSNK